MPRVLKYISLVTNSPSTCNALFTHDNRRKRRRKAASRASQTREFPPDAQGVHAIHAIPHRGSLFYPESITWLGSRPILSVRERAPRVSLRSASRGKNRVCVSTYTGCTNKRRQIQDPKPVIGTFG